MREYKPSGPLRLRHLVAGQPVGCLDLQAVQVDAQQPEVGEDGRVQEARAARRPLLQLRAQLEQQTKQAWTQDFQQRAHRAGAPQLHNTHFYLLTRKPVKAPGQESAQVIRHHLRDAQVSTFF